MSKHHRLALLVGLALAGSASGAELWVSPAGNDANPGTHERPFATLVRAREVVRALPQRAEEPVTVILRGGAYRLRETLVFTAADSGAADAPVEYRSAEGETAVVSGGEQLRGLQWRPFRDGIQQTQVPVGFRTDQLFVNGEPMPMARYPNFDPNQRIFNGTAADAISDARVARWKDPAGGFFHAMHRNRWGGMHFRILGKDAKGKLMYEGGWQNNRPSAPHKDLRFVENIFEELDAPGEWFLDAKTATLYFYPPPGLDLASAAIEGVRLRHLVEFRGTEQSPVQFVSLRGITFRHAARTFMENKERILRTDWTIYRGGAVFLTGTEDCRIIDCTIDHVGGNALFVNNYNRRLLVRGCHIFQAGGNGIALVGDPKAVRDGLVGYSSRADFADIDKTPGPKTPDYPGDSRVEDCLIHEIGRVEKQVAGVEIDMAMNITVSHCSIYDTPRAGVNIGDGCWGGHVIEFCDVFDTVLETGDHGSFNSWGRDRFWGLRGVDLNTITLGEHKNLPLLDVIRPNILRNNRWRCDHGWDIDLDDGSSNYRIYNNLCLNGGLKNREGFYRIVENNITVNNSFHPHVWYGNSQDVFRRNIVFTPYKPIRVKKPWGKEVDFNLLHQPGASGAQPSTLLPEQSGGDEPFSGDDAPIRVLIVDGFSNHDWKLTTALIRGVIEPTKLFTVDVTTAPPTAAAPGWDAWRPEFSDYDVVIQNCNDINGGPSWPREVQAAFEEFVSQGGGVYVWHSGNNAFSAWPAYNDMIGLGWRKKEFGPAIAIDEHEQLVRIPAGEGENTGHGARHNTVVHRLGDDPIHAGLPRAWKTPDLEVYYYARGPAKNLTVLSYGFDPKTKMNWPLEWVVTYGQGRVYTSTFGHVWKGDTEPVGMRCAGVQAILIRALQWLAHREVTWPAPPDFPTAEKISVRGEIPLPDSALAQSPATALQELSGRDEHSIVADARFVDPAKGDYRVKEGSPALALGFENFPMDQFGVSSERLRRLARTPELPLPGHARKKKSRRDSRVTAWLGARVKNIIGLGEVSAAGLPGETGVSVLEAPAGSAAAKAGLEVGDVILKCAGRTIRQMSDLERRWRAAAPGPVVLQVWRGQNALPVTVTKE